MAKFRDAQRIQMSLLSGPEKRTLIWLAERTPRFINSDHLTAMGLLAMMGAGFSYWMSGSYPAAGLLLATFCLALNWLGDSLDGTLARVRNKLRPRYGFYVDHVVDMLGALFLLGGLASSGYMSTPVAGGLVIAFLMLSINCYLATYTLGQFQISFAHSARRNCASCLRSAMHFFSGSPMPRSSGRDCSCLMSAAQSASLEWRSC